MSKQLIEQAIADAKALRESAYELAKEQIAETFGPKVQEMIRLKLSEMEDIPVEEGLDEYGDEHPIRTSDALGLGSEEDIPLDETSLDELIAELDAEEQIEEGKDKEEVDESKEEVDEAKEDEEEEETEDEEEETEEEGDEETADDEQVVDITVEELKDIIADVVGGIMGGGEDSGEESLDAEMDDTGEEMPIDGAEGEEEISLDGGEEEQSLDEILASLEEEDKVEEKKEPVEEKKEDKELKETRRELKEALKLVRTLQKDLTDLNILNAKLLYTNKLFRNNNLSESQKAKIIPAIDRAETIKEVKKIYQTIDESLKTPKTGKKVIKENLGFASKAAGFVKKTDIVEQDDIVSRWQVLAGIKKIK